MRFERCGGDDTGARKFECDHRLSRLCWLITLRSLEVLCKRGAGYAPAASVPVMGLGGVKRRCLELTLSFGVLGRDAEANGRWQGRALAL
jgi:hypothetical protein